MAVITSITPFQVTMVNADRHFHGPPPNEPDPENTHTAQGLLYENRLRVPADKVLGLFSATASSASSSTSTPTTSSSQTSTGSSRPRPPLVYQVYQDPTLAASLSIVRLDAHDVDALFQEHAKARALGPTFRNGQPRPQPKPLKNAFQAASTITLWKGMPYARNGFSLRLRGKNFVEALLKDVKRQGDSVAAILQRSREQWVSGTPTPPGVGPATLPGRTTVTTRTEDTTPGTAGTAADTTPAIAGTAADTTGDGARRPAPQAQITSSGGAHSSSMGWFSLESGKKLRPVTWSWVYIAGHEGRLAGLGRSHFLLRKLKGVVKRVARLRHASGAWGSRAAGVVVSSPRDGGARGRGRQGGLPPLRPPGATSTMATPAATRTTPFPTVLSSSPISSAGTSDATGITRTPDNFTDNSTDQDSTDHGALERRIVDGKLLWRWHNERDCVPRLQECERHPFCYGVLRTKTSSTSPPSGVRVVAPPPGNSSIKSCHLLYLSSLFSGDELLQVRKMSHTQLYSALEELFARIYLDQELFRRRKQILGPQGGQQQQQQHSTPPAYFQILPADNNLPLVSTTLCSRIREQHEHHRRTEKSTTTTHGEGSTMSLADATHAPDFSHTDSCIERIYLKRPHLETLPKGGLLWEEVVERTVIGLGATTVQGGLIQGGGGGDR